MIKAILFDMGNVLMNFDADKISRNFREYFPFVDAQRLEDFVARSIMPYERGDFGTDVFLQKLSELSPEIAAMSPSILQKLWSDIFREHTDNIRLLPQLSALYRLIMVSNTNPMHIDFLQANYPQVFAPFDDFVFSYEIHAAKPDPAIYLHAVARSGVAPEECLFIDDKAENIDAARALGIKTCFFTGTQYLGSMLREIGIKFGE
jgi:glucose-1-phosphatase